MRRGEDYKKLYEFVKKAKFDKLGVFMYSKEDGTPAERLPEQVHHSTKKKRRNEIMELANRMSEDNLKKNIGRTVEVLIEGETFDRKYYIGRSYMDIPDTDGIMYIENTESALIGQFVKCEIEGVKEYDLIGKIIG